MPVNLSIKNVPDDIAARIRRRAARNHRSLQGELVAILEEVTAQESALLTSPDQLLQQIRDLGLKTPSEASRFIRKDRDARSRR